MRRIASVLFNVLRLASLVRLPSCALTACQFGRNQHCNGRGTPTFSTSLTNNAPYYTQSQTGCICDSVAFDGSSASKCGSCSANLFGPNCDCSATKCGQYALATPCDDLTGECNCDSKHLGSTSSCNVCTANYYSTVAGGNDCATFCIAASTCSGNGFCSATGTCSCAFSIWLLICIMHRASLDLALCAHPILTSLPSRSSFQAILGTRARPVPLAQPATSLPVWARASAWRAPIRAAMCRPCRPPYRRPRVPRPAARRL
jgi:hypothetical protein